MKPTLLSFLALGAFAGALGGQTPPASVEAKALAVEAKTLTKEERANALDYLQQTQREFLAAIAGVSEEQWRWKAAPERWSIAETAEHIALAEQTVWGLVSEKIMKSPAAPEKRAEVKGKDEMILKMIPDRSTKVQAPERLQPTGKWATRAALVKDFEATRAQEIAYLTETKADLRNHFEEHPFLKTLDAYQWLILNGAHAKRHTAQILEVKADPNFPKS